MHRLCSCCLLTVLALAGPYGCSMCGEPESGNEIAHIEQPSGKVEWRQGKTAEWNPAPAATVLGIDDAVRTGSDGNAKVVFADGGELYLKPGSLLSFKIEEDEITLVLSQGELDAAASGKAGGLRVDVGGGKKPILLSKGRAKFSKTEKGVRAESDKGATLAFADGSKVHLAKNTSVDMGGLEEEFEMLLEQGDIEVESKKKGKHGFKLVFGESSQVSMTIGKGSFSRTSSGVRINMIMGQASVEQAGHKKMIEAGTSYDMNIGKFEITRREALPATLKDPRRACRIRPPGSRSFKLPRRRVSAIDPGTALRVRNGGTAILADSSANRVEIASASRAVFNGVFRTGQERDGEIELQSGQVRIRLRREGGAAASQVVRAPQMKVTARALGLTAESDLTASKSASHLVVHAGEAQVDIGDKRIRVKAGQSLGIDKNGKLTGPRDLPLPRVRAKEGMRTQVYYDRSLPPVAFALKSGEGSATPRLELSRSSSFKSLLLGEPLARPVFRYAGLSPGKYFFRVRRGDADGSPAGKAGVVIFTRDPFLLQSRRSSSVTNVVPDTGEETRIFFQGRAPALTFSWSPVERANSYRVRVYSEDNLEKPVVTKDSKKNRLKLAAGKLREGTFYWYQAALDTTGKEIAQSGMNKLSLLFDNAAYLLRIDSPAPGQRPRAGEIELRGVAATGASLSANDRAVSLDSDGRFEEILSGVPKRGFVVFQLKKPGLGETYFVRRLGN
jgi:ferric-dicitrate binding protein FerR (iron transport regulator)